MHDGDYTPHVAERNTESRRRTIAGTSCTARAGRRSARTVGGAGTIRVSRIATWCPSIVVSASPRTCRKSAAKSSSWRSDCGAASLGPQEGACPSCEARGSGARFFYALRLSLRTISRLATAGNGCAADRSSRPAFLLPRALRSCPDPPSTRRYRQRETNACQVDSRAG
jgi:hypothetical protein